MGGGRLRGLWSHTERPKTMAILPLLGSEVTSPVRVLAEWLLLEAEGEAAPGLSYPLLAAAVRDVLDL